MVDRENSADGDVNVDIGRAVQRIHQHDVFAALCSFEDYELVFFFRGDPRHDAARFQRRFQLLVREEIELHLLLALDVFNAACAENIYQAGFVDVAMDDFRAQLNSGN